MGKRVYLDHNATSPVRPEAIEAVTLALMSAGNPSSVHALGRSARALIEDARGAVAKLAGADSDQIVFTSGGAEANALALHSAAASGDCGRLVVGATEHDTLLQLAKSCGLPIDVWPVDSRGVAELDWLQQHLRAWRPADGRPFVALMLANNETGVIQPVAETARLVRDAGGWLHVDAVQAAGKLGIDLEALGADSLSLSAHKLGGPQGVGALVHRERASIRPVLRGGGQERGLRAGTENTPGIAGFGAAARAARAGLAEAQLQASWRNAVEQRLEREAGIVTVGKGARRLAATLCIATRGFASALQVMALDLEGVMVSSGAACSSGKVKPSHVLAAMGHSDLAGNGLRASGGWTTTEDDWDRFAEVWLAVHARQQARARVEEFA